MKEPICYAPTIYVDRQKPSHSSELLVGTVRLYSDDGATLLLHLPQPMMVSPRALWEILAPMVRDGRSLPAFSVETPVVTKGPIVEYYQERLIRQLQQATPPAESGGRQRRRRRRRRQRRKQSA